MIVAAGTNRRVQKRAVSKTGWTKARCATFLTALAETCNVRHACRIVGKPHTSAYALRGRDAGFAAAWADALASGYDRLESELLSCALGYAATEADVDQDGSGEGGSTGTEHAALTVRPFDPDLALKALALRNAAMRAGPRRGASAPGTGHVALCVLEAALTRSLDAIEKRSVRAGTVTQRHEVPQIVDGGADTGRDRGGVDTAGVSR